MLSGECILVGEQANVVSEDLVGLGSYRAGWAFLCFPFLTASFVLYSA